MKTKRSFILSLLALVLILCAFIQPAWAYFTSSKQADGAIPISFIRKTKITEEVGELTKKVTIQNDKTSTVYVWVRARAYAGGQYELNVSSNGGWTKNGDWWYYNTPVPPGGSTEDPLVVTLVIPDPKNFKPTDVVNVGVVYESTTAFDKDADISSANWEPEFVDYTGISTPNP